MGNTIDARLPTKIVRKLARSSAYALAADLIPSIGAREIQSANASGIARKTFRNRQRSRILLSA